MPQIFSVSNDFALKVGSDEPYDPKILEEVDRQIRNMPMVKAYLKGKANELKSLVGSKNFEVIMSTAEGQSRPRAYVAPSNHDGIHEELSEAVLLKAALGMSGK
jgi:hypothetical protein